MRVTEAMMASVEMAIAAVRSNTVLEEVESVLMAYLLQARVGLGCFIGHFTDTKCRGLSIASKEPESESIWKIVAEQTLRL